MGLRSLVNWLGLWKRESVLPDLSKAYMDPCISSKQRALVDPQLSQMYRGQAPAHFSTLADLFAQIPGNESLTVLDAGCASGYYYEILRHLCQFQGRYIGADFNLGMLAMAQQRYPDIPFSRMDIRNLGFRDCSFSVVLSGATIVHIREWQRAVAELARVADRWLILHRTLVRSKGSTSVRVETHYDVNVYRVYISEVELIDLLQELDYQLQSKVDCPEGISSSDFGNYTYLFRRQNA
jgi:SAM-dependent methyltransferase